MVAIPAVICRLNIACTAKFENSRSNTLLETTPRSRLALDPLDEAFLEEATNTALIGVPVLSILLQLKSVRIDLAIRKRRGEWIVTLSKRDHR